MDDLKFKKLCELTEIAISNGDNIQVMSVWEIAATDDVKMAVALWVKYKVEISHATEELLPPDLFCVEDAEEMHEKIRICSAELRGFL